MEANLNIATRLVKGLSSEKIRWQEERQLMIDNYEKLIGDCILNSAFMIQMGPFESTQRHKVLQEDWFVNIQNMKTVPYSEDQDVIQNMSNEVERTMWNSDGLSMDTQSLQNGIMTTKSQRYSLCIDPQQQAIRWLKKMYASQKMKTYTFNDDYMKWIEMAIKHGQPFMFEGVTDSIDPMIVPILDQNYVYKGGAKILSLNGNDIEVSENFRLFLLTKMNNPSYTPEIFAACQIIN